MDSSGVSIDTIPNLCYISNRLLTFEETIVKAAQFYGGKIRVEHLRRYKG